MQLPQQFLDSLAGIKGFDKGSFIDVHASGKQVTSVRLNPAKSSAPFATEQKVPWSSYGYYLPERPSFTFDPLFHAGCYYVQEASGMFLEQAIKQTTNLSQPLKVLDLCAAPGGKSTLLQSLISSNSLLVSNEVIKSRATILEENLTKWGALNVVVTNNDPKDFARLENFFDVIVVDAPCSGSGLFRREPEAVDEWSEQNVQLCHQRQQRILADVYPALRQNGVLIYCTCSYSKEEDEDILDWICEELALDSLPLAIPDEWGIVEVQSARQNASGYRFFPDKIKGEGFFIACFRKKDGDGDGNVMKVPKKSALQKASKSEVGIIQPWIKADSLVHLWKQDDWIFAFPPELEKELLIIAGNMYIRKAGVAVGKIAGEGLIPDHALAVSTIISDKTVGVSLKKAEALQYLRKEEIILTTPHKGWALVQYENCILGWVKVLPSRINNYYPKEWRILKKF